jgi:dienelactone hydrolase
MSVFLTEIASHGFIIFASGAPGGSGTTTTKMMNDSLAFIISKAGSGKYAQVDTTTVAAAGYSCGGLEALDLKDDPRLGYIGVFDSGYLQNQERATTIKKPVFYFLGGSTDVAYANVC